MIVDCGRDTVDLTTRELLENGLGEITSKCGDFYGERRLEFIESKVGSGGFYGGSFVEKQFLKFIESKVGSGAINLLKENHYGQYQYMIREFCEHVHIPFTGEDTSFSYEFDLEASCPVLRDYTSGK